MQHDSIDIPDRHKNDIQVRCHEIFRFFAPKMNLTNLVDMEIGIVFNDFPRYFSNETHFLYYTDYHTRKTI